jgi:hypothetical protein
MEAVPRPEWAAPLIAGVHVREFRSALPEEETREIVGVLRDDPGLVSFLARHPLGLLEFSGGLPDEGWRASYVPLTADLAIETFRPPSSFGYELLPEELPTVSAAARTYLGALQRSFYHELGHHVLATLGPHVEYEVRLLKGSGRVNPISDRARRNAIEYFAETFAAYRFEDSLADRDPEGYDIVEAVRRLAWRV